MIEWMTITTGWTIILLPGKKRVRSHSLAKNLLSLRRHSLQAHTHTPQHIFFGLNLRVLQELPVATSPSSLVDFKTEQKTMDI